jgi:hypothetical protein
MHLASGINSVVRALPTPRAALTEGLPTRDDD